MWRSSRSQVVGAEPPAGQPLGMALPSHRVNVASTRGVTTARSAAPSRPPAQAVLLADGDAWVRTLVDCEVLGSVGFPFIAGHLVTVVFGPDLIEFAGSFDGDIAVSLDDIVDLRIEPSLGLRPCVAVAGRSGRRHATGAVVRLASVDAEEVWFACLGASPLTLKTILEPVLSATRSAG